jgi:hypothetical protein
MAHFEILNSNPAVFFTEKEWEVILHRLEVPDAICEAIEMDYELVSQTCDWFINRRQETGLLHPTDLIPTQKQVIANCVESSTYFALAYTEVSGETSKLGGLTRVCNSVERKVSHLVGRTVELPRR